MGEDQLWSHIEVYHPVIMMVDWTDSYGGKLMHIPTSHLARNIQFREKTTILFH